ncbi:MAG: hypothetical protein IJ874_10880 [Ruminococcus sp.]|nr:hypothetical protein [Ruminococcus sp.]
MANKLIRGLTVTIGADTSKLSAAVKEAEAQVRGAKTEIREIQSALSKAGDSAELWQQKQTVLTTAIESSKKKLDELKTAQKSLTEQLRDGDIDQKKYDEFQAKLTKARDKLSELKKQQENVEAEFKSGSIDKEAYDKFTDKVHRAELKVKDLETAEHSLEENVRLGNVSEEQYRAFQREIQQTEGDIADNERKIAEYRARLSEKYRGSGVEDELNAAIAEFGELSAGNYMNYRKFMSPDWYSEVSGFADSINMDNISLRSEKNQIARNNYVIEQYEKAELSANLIQATQEQMTDAQWLHDQGFPVGVN